MIAYFFFYVVVSLDLHTVQKKNFLTPTVKISLFHKTSPVLCNHSDGERAGPVNLKSILIGHLATHITIFMILENKVAVLISSFNFWRVNGIKSNASASLVQWTVEHLSYCSWKCADNFLKEV